MDEMLKKLDDAVVAAARKAGIELDENPFQAYEQTIAAERERCAKVVLDYAGRHPRTGRVLRMLAVKIRKGGGLTAMLPTDGIPDHLKDNIIVVET